MKKGAKATSHMHRSDSTLPLTWLRKISKRISSKDPLQSKDDIAQMALNPVGAGETSLIQDEESFANDNCHNFQQCSETPLSTRKRVRVESPTSRDSPKKDFCSLHNAISHEEKLQECKDCMCDTSANDPLAINVGNINANHNSENSDDEELNFLNNLTHDYDFNRNSLDRTVDTRESQADKITLTSDKCSYPSHLQKDFLGSILVPQPRFDKYWDRDTLVVTPNSFMKNISLGLLQQDITQRTGRCSLLREMFEPSATALNMKIFGGKKAVQQEQEKARRAGCVIHPCSKFRYVLSLLCEK